MLGFTGSLHVDLNQGGFRMLLVKSAAHVEYGVMQFDKTVLLIGMRRCCKSVFIMTATCSLL